MTSLCYTEANQWDLAIYSYYAGNVRQYSGLYIASSYFIDMM